MNLFIKYILALSVVVCYLYYTIGYTSKFRKNRLYSGKIKTLHYILFWLIPFVWIWLINALSKTAKGSHEIKKKTDPESFGGHYQY